MEGKGIPQNGPKLELVIKDCEQFVAEMKEGRFLNQSVYTNVVRPPNDPETPSNM